MATVSLPRAALAEPPRGDAMAARDISLAADAASGIQPMPAGQQQRGVAVGEEAVALGDGVGVDRADPLDPISAETSIISVDFGRWKFVISPSATRKSKPGVMKMSVSPRQGRMAPPRAGALDQAQGGGADGDDPAARGAGGGDLGRGGLR